MPSPARTSTRASTRAPSHSGTAGTGSAVIVNSGAITVAVDATATAQAAVAIAAIGGGIDQDAQGPSLAVASLVNSGTIALTAEADAGNNGTATFAWRVASIGVGISQSAFATATGGVATATLVNTGGILISVDADGALASDGSATAVAVVGSAINQFAFASSAANVGLLNNGTLSVLADASAIADEDGAAIAGIGSLIIQSASAFGTGGNASVSLVNNGSLIADADATVFAGNDVFVSAFVGAGIQQFGFGGTTGTANVSLVNNGLLSITADALGIGGGTGLGLRLCDWRRPGGCRRQRRNREPRQHGDDPRLGRRGHLRWQCCPEGRDRCCGSDCAWLVAGCRRDDGNGDRDSHLYGGIPGHSTSVRHNRGRRLLGYPDCDHHAERTGSCLGAEQRHDRHYCRG